MSFLTKDEKITAWRFTLWVIICIALWVLGDFLNHRQNQLYFFDFEKDNLNSIALNSAIVTYFIAVLAFSSLLFLYNELTFESAFVVLFKSVFIAWFVWGVISIFDTTFGKTVNRLSTTGKETYQFYVQEKNKDGSFDMYTLDKINHVRDCILPSNYKVRDTIEVSFRTGLLGYKHSPTLDGNPLMTKND